jgi:hypothetical protein
MSVRTGDAHLPWVPRAGALALEITPERAGGGTRDCAR